MEAIIKHQLVPCGIQKSVYPKERPQFNEWIREIYERAKKQKVLNTSS